MFVFKKDEASAMTEGAQDEPELYDSASYQGSFLDLLNLDASLEDNYETASELEREIDVPLAESDGFDDEMESYVDNTEENDAPSRPPSCAPSRAPSPEEMGIAAAGHPLDDNAIVAAEHHNPGRRPAIGPFSALFASLGGPQTVPNGNAIFAEGRRDLGRPIDISSLPSLPSLISALEGLSSETAPNRHAIFEPERPDPETASVISVLAVAYQHPSAADDGAAGDVAAGDGAAGDGAAGDGSAGDGAAGDGAAGDGAAGDGAAGDGAAGDGAAGDGAAGDGAAGDGAAGAGAAGDGAAGAVQNDAAIIDIGGGDAAVLPAEVPADQRGPIELDDSLAAPLLRPTARPWYFNRSFWYLPLIGFVCSAMVAIVLFSLSLVAPK